MKTDFLPVNNDEMKKNGWKKADVIIVTCDEYVDHPYYEIARVGRVLVSSGMRTVIISNPGKDEDFKKFGKPELFFLLITGKEDSMTMNYSAFKKFRSSDPFQKDGERSNRPDRAIITITSKLKSLYKDCKVVLAGAEASGRRITHYDFWGDQIRKPVLFDSKADLLIFDKLELNVQRTANHMKSDLGFESLYGQPGISYISKDKPVGYEELPSYDECRENKETFISMYRTFLANIHPGSNGLFQKVLDRYIVINKNHLPYDNDQLKIIFNQSYRNKPHFGINGEIPFFEKVLSNGLFTQIGDLSGNTYIHEGRDISQRGIGALVMDSDRTRKSKYFKSVLKNPGYGKGDQYALDIRKPYKCNSCVRYTCLETAGKDFCSNLSVNVPRFTKAMDDISDFKGIRQVYFDNTFDYRILNQSDDLLKDILKKRTGTTFTLYCGSFSDIVRKANDLPPSEPLKKFVTKFKKKCGEFSVNKTLKIVLTSGMPGETLDTVLDTLQFVIENNLIVAEVRPFVPLPLSLSSIVYNTERNIYSGEELIVIKNVDERKLLDKIFGFQKPGNRKELLSYFSKKELKKHYELVKSYDVTQNKKVSGR
ncbi:MAG: hypothetical protein JXR48_13525 [Candidatus Delongbacteria bacterium]|nr:hypothetical protein [Candidatus Delongbacteria bacterium]MBN2835976.1 hypothetical protein [Candidatus Delongbacteria bacterium]